LQEIEQATLSGPASRDPQDLWGGKPLDACSLKTVPFAQTTEFGFSGADLARTFDQDVRIPLRKDHGVLNLMGQKARPAAGLVARLRFLACPNYALVMTCESGASELAVDGTVEIALPSGAGWNAPAIIAGASLRQVTLQADQQAQRGPLISIYRDADSIEMSVLYAPPVYSQWSTACRPSLEEASRSSFGVGLAALRARIRGDSLRCTVTQGTERNAFVVDGVRELAVRPQNGPACSLDPYPIELSVRSSQGIVHIVGEASVLFVEEQRGQEASERGPAIAFSGTMSRRRGRPPKELVTFVPCAAREQPSLTIRGRLRHQNGTTRIVDATWNYNLQCADVGVSCELQSITDN